MKTTLKESPDITAPSLLLPCLLLGLLAGCATRPPIASELQRLQGTWEGVMVGQESDGKITVTITGNSLHFHRDTNFWFETTFTLPAGTNPKQLHATINKCADGESTGKVVLAIYKIEAGTLTLAGIRTPDSAPEPPVNFDSEPTMSGNFELRKVQPQKKNARSPTSKVTVGETSQPPPITGNAPALEPGRKHPAELAKFASGPDLLPVPIAFQNVGRQPSLCPKAASFAPAPLTAKPRRTASSPSMSSNSRARAVSTATARRLTA